MEEKTIRYLGHAQLFKLIIDSGFLSDKAVKVDGGNVLPKKVALEVLRPLLSQGDEKDMTILIVEVTSKKGKRKYTCVDYYDEKNHITSMERMTGYTCSIITQCIKDYPGFGVIPPEYLGMDKKLCGFIKYELKQRKIIIKTSNNNN